jgi:protein lifeguard
MLVFFVFLFVLLSDGPLTYGRVIGNGVGHSGVVIARGPFEFNGPQPGRRSDTSSSSSSSFRKYEQRTLQDFQTRDSRLGFIRKVYSIFGVQMAATVGITAFIMSNFDVALFLIRNLQSVVLSTGLISTAVVIALGFSPNLRYNAPYNFLLLGLFTFCQAVVVGSLSVLVPRGLVCVAALHTLTAFFAITLYSFQPNPKYDLSQWGNGLLAVLSSVLVTTFLNVFLRIPLFESLQPAILAVVFALYIG